ncbi:ATP-dependent helicase [soil metagenome]
MARSLNPQQRQAVEHGGNATPADALLVIAGAGSGKTDTLANRVAWLVNGGADPRRILLLTFSRRAAAEMERRVGSLLAAGSVNSSARIHLEWSGTFHAIGARLLREYAARIGLPEHFTIHDRGDSEDLMGIVRERLGFASTTRRFPARATCLLIYSRAVNSRKPLERVLATAFPWCASWHRQLGELFEAYALEKQSHHVLDYDDLLLCWSAMLESPVIAAAIGARFDHVLVDEYQDTNRLQSAILEALKPDGRGVMVVGDDAQAIYSFRAATVRNILDFPQRFGPRVHTLTLDRNYRSTQPILDASNAVIAGASERHAKDLWTDRTSDRKPALLMVRDEIDQAACVAERVLEQREAGMKLRSQAVLFRSGHHSATLELELTRRNIPFVKFGGLRFLEAAHVKDLLAVLRWAENPRARLAGFRVAQMVPGVGPAAAAQLLDAMAVVDEPIVPMRAFDSARVDAIEWQALVDLITALRSREQSWPGDLSRVRQWYEPQLPRLHDDAPARLADLMQLEQMAAAFGTRERFLTELTLDPPAATSDESQAPELDEDYLVLSTIHSAKGLEWKSVHVLNVVDGCIPSDMATGSEEELEEERRLLYVAMTRARDQLSLMVPQRFYVHQQAGGGDRHVYGARTRFIADEMLHRFATEAWPAVVVETARPVTLPNPEPAIDVTARLRSMWR